MKQIADEYVNKQIAKNKEYYKTPEKQIDEMIGLLKKIKVTFKDDPNKLWMIITAVSEAYHVVLWVDKNEKAERLANTIFSFVENNSV